MNILIRIASGFILSKKARKKFRKKYLKKESLETIQQEKNTTSDELRDVVTKDELNEHMIRLTDYLYLAYKQQCRTNNEDLAFDVAELFTKRVVTPFIHDVALTYLWQETDMVKLYDADALLSSPQCVLYKDVELGQKIDFRQKHLDALAYALKKNIPFIMTEDGFLRSADTWCNYSVHPMYRSSVCHTFTTDVHYFDATRPSTMEKLLNDEELIITDEQRVRARKCINRIVSTHLTKYNHQPIYTPEIGRKGVCKVLVVDQSYGDNSISQGLANDETFARMLNDAIAENPGADIIIKKHPDSMAAKTVRKMSYYSDIVAHDNIYTFTTPINPISLIKYVDKVYVCTTQLGFEALMCGKEVHTYGMPYYAGWGITHDAIQCSRRTNKRSLEEIFYIAYIIYSHYVNPEKKCRCEIEEAMDFLLKLRVEYFNKFGIRNDLSFNQ